MRELRELGRLRDQGELGERRERRGLRERRELVLPFRGHLLVPILRIWLGVLYAPKIQDLGATGRAPRAESWRG